MDKYLKQYIIFSFCFFLSFISKIDPTLNVKDDFIKIEDRTILFKDMFNIDLDRYLVLFYSSSCMSCRDTLKVLNNRVFSQNLDIYSIDINNDNVNFKGERHSNIGVSSVDEFYIYSFPTLSFFKEKVVVNELYGLDDIRKENLYIFFE